MTAKKGLGFSDSGPFLLRKNKKICTMCVKSVDKHAQCVYNIIKDKEINKANKTEVKVMKITGIKKAVGDYKKVYGNSQKYGRLMYNTKTGKVWTSERYNQDMVYYEDENIVDITSDVESFYFEDEYPTNGYETNVTMKHVRAVIERYYMAGEVA